jgi:hypothetical protein
MLGDIEHGTKTKYKEQETDTTHQALFISK